MALKLIYSTARHDTCSLLGDNYKSSQYLVFQLIYVKWYMDEYLSRPSSVAILLVFRPYVQLKQRLPGGDYWLLLNQCKVCLYKAK